MKPLERQNQTWCNVKLPTFKTKKNQRTEITVPRSCPKDEQHCLNQVMHLHCHSLKHRVLQSLKGNMKTSSNISRKPTGIHLGLNITMGRKVAEYQLITESAPVHVDQQK
jgi:hypothetical protein